MHIEGKKKRIKKKTACVYCVGFNYRDDLLLKEWLYWKAIAIYISSEIFDKILLVGVEFNFFKFR